MKGTLTSLESGSQSELLNVSLIGRSAECNLNIADPRVSRRHAMIRKQDDGYWIFDLGSFNGCYINGARVTATRQLKDGDVLNFADHEFRFDQEGGSTNFNDLGGSTIALIRSKPVIILVSDIQGFTPLSEQLEPDNLAQIIGSWYGDCEVALTKYNATVDKFSGDSVLAYWTDVSENSFKNSLLAARDLLASCHKIYDQHQDVFKSAGQSFGAGVALHTGNVAYGGMSQGEFTLLGDPVNLTFRLEGLTRHFDHDIVTTSDFVKAAPSLFPHLENIGSYEVKGRVEPVDVWGVNSFPPE